MKKYYLLLFSFISYVAVNAQSAGSIDFYNTTYANILKNTSYGKIVKRGTPTPPSTIADKTSSDYVHIFIDEYGNLITDNLPNGVPWVNYVIHIVHPPATDQNFGIVQTSGSISGSFVVQNSSAASRSFVAGTRGASVTYVETVSTLSPSDAANIGFQVIKTVIDASGAATKSTIATYTLTMSGFSNASIDVGIIESKLQKPTYTLVNSPTTSGTMVVKSADGDNRTMTTVMGTLYFSPIVFMERLLDKNNTPLFKAKGRSSIADHTIYERFYPTFGLSINDNSFQNIFYGINWEVIRGGSLFFGFHTGKINTYNHTDPNFAFGSTAVTQDQFNYNSDIKWDTKFAIGATISLKVVLGLLSTQVK